MSASTRWLIGIALAVTTVVVASVVAAVVLGDGEAQFEAGTPEAVAQSYFRAIQDRDIEGAMALLTSDLGARCSAEELRRTSRYEEDFAVRIRDTTLREQVAELDVRISIRGGGGPFGDGYDIDRVMVLDLEGGEWRIAEPPWPLYWCPETPPTPGGAS